MPMPLVTLYYYAKFGCMVSPRAEVEVSPNLTIGRKSVVSSFTKVKATHGRLSIGARVDIATGCFIASQSGGLTIGDHCMFGPNVSVVASNYSYARLDVPIREQEITSKGIIIEDNVWIGAGSVVLDGARIGSGTIVAPNSVVGGTIPPNSIASGNPAKVIFTRRA